MTRVPCAADEKTEIPPRDRVSFSPAGGGKRYAMNRDPGLAVRTTGRRGRGADMDARLDRLRNRLEESRAIAEIAARHLRRLLRR
jgi:hypothetical protein